MLKGKSRVGRPTDMAALFSSSTSPLVKAAIAATLVTGGLGGFLVLRQLTPKAPPIAEPPPLHWTDAVEPAVAPAEPPPPSSPPMAPEKVEPVPTFVASAPLPNAPEVPVSQLARDDLNGALGAAKD